MAFSCLLALCLLAPMTTPAAPVPEALSDESKVAAYTLPDVLRAQDGSRISSAEAWRKDRPALVRVFEEQVYGRAPGRPQYLRFELRESDANALDGAATRKQIAIRFSDKPGAPTLDLLVYLPKKAAAKAPVFLGLNFWGNHTAHADPNILLPRSWVADNEARGVEGNRASDKARGAQSSRWPIEAILERGYGVATAYYGDLNPDFNGGFGQSVRALFLRDGQDRQGDNEWGAVAAWAWGLSRALDYLETDADVDARRVAVHGHSRLGKAALWAGATDERFALVISNNSGCGGAALSKRVFGETVARINTSFPHWFARNFRAYNSREDSLPVDQHQLMALVAPRPLYVASAQEDSWADPRGEYLSLRHADPLYRLLSGEGLDAAEMPPIESPVMSRLGYHIRRGGHGVTRYDWDRFMDFADKHMALGRK